MSQSGILKVADNILPPDVPTTFICDVGSAVPLAHTLDVFGGAGIQTVGLGNVITINITTSGFTWNTVTSLVPVNPITISKENGYICNGVAMVTFILPLAPAIGDSFIIISNTARFQILQNGGQQLCIGTASTTIGAGNLTSNSTGDKVEFVYMGGNIFRGFAPQGTLTLI